MRPQPTEAEIQFILDAIAEYLTVEVRRSDVLSAWSGIRPLAVDPNAASTQEALRDHVVTVDADRLVTVTGDDKQPRARKANTLDCGLVGGCIVAVDAGEPVPMQGVH